MIVVFHDREKVTRVFDHTENKELSYNEKTIQKTLFRLSEELHPEFVCWCHSDLQNHLNYKHLKTIFHHKLIMASFSTSGEYAISNKIGYVEDSTFLKVKRDVTYPTWLMSSDIGGVSSQVLSKFKLLANKKIAFDFFLNNLSRKAIKKGLFCYSEPKLLVGGYQKLETPYQENIFTFVKSHYRFRWLFLLLTNYFVHERRLKIWSFLKGFMATKYSNDTIDFDDVEVHSVKETLSDTSYDVLIPTLGRAEVLKDVLLDLAEQTMIPNKVIIVEQNSQPNSKTELDYVYDLNWPFVIDHTFINQLGACNARNITLSKVESTWVFFADDDIRMSKNLIENAFSFMTQYGISALNMASLQKNEVLSQKIPIQWHAFSTNSSIVEASVASDIKFGMEHEFGYGEDTDYGMKIRNKGTDIIFYPNTDILHLKAPIGGFRAKMELAWEKGEIQPKPSPTVMAYRLKHTTKEQLLGYKLTLFIKFFKSEGVKNPFTYRRFINKRWYKSLHWANVLINKYKSDGV